MEYLLVMSLAGTVSGCICILLGYLMKGRISAGMQYLLLKISVLYYLVPLPFLKKWYQDILVHFTRFRLIENGHISIYDPRSYRMVRVGGSVHINRYMKMQMAAVTVWMIFAIFILMAELYHYGQKAKFVISCIHHVNVEQEVITVERKIGPCRLMQKVMVYYVLHDGENMTFGLFRPVILCGAVSKSPEAGMVLGHEIAHVKRFDVFWKILFRLVVILHWWNPIVWLIRRRFEWTCECSCDDLALQGKTMEERKAYMCLLISESGRGGREGAGRMRWGMDFKGEMIRLSERMENAMSMKKRSKAAAWITAVLFMMVNSVTVFAYPEVTTVGGEWESVEEAERFINSPSTFIPEGAGEEERKKDMAYEIVRMEIRYDKQFTDAYGNIYQVKDDMGASVYRSCSHEYVSGTYAEHNKSSDGSCTVVQYSAKRCSKRGNVEKNNRLFVINYDVCPH